MRRLTIIGLMAVLAACVEQMPLPPVEEAITDFSAGDTSYVRLYPAWGPELGLGAPVEVSISYTRHVFVADSLQRHIFVFDLAGRRLDNASPVFETLDLALIGPDYAPHDIDVDGRMNVLIINGSDKLYRWNLYWNLYGIDSVASAIMVQSTSDSTNRLWLPADTSVLIQRLNSSEWRVVLDSTRFVYNPERIDSLLRPHLFFDLSSPLNKDLDWYYSQSKITSRFSAISRARLEDDYFYVADSAHHRIIRARLKRNGLVRLSNGEIFFTHIALFDQTSLDYGTGAGKVNRPVGLDVDNFGNVYYTQLGRFVHVNSVSYNAGEERYQSNFELDLHEIMDSDWYRRPYDIAVGQDQMIYIANTDAREILVFNGEGEYFHKAGVTNVTVDTTYWIRTGFDSTAVDTSLWIVSGTDSTLVDTTLWIRFPTDSTRVDTFTVRELRGELGRPVSVDVDDRGVIYVCDPDSARVLRYTLSTNLDESLTIPQQ